MIVLPGEIETRHGAPEVPTAESFGALLGRYMWVHEVRIDFGARLRISGNLKPGSGAKTPSEIRRSFSDSLDAIMAILDAAGATWERHPEVAIRGDVLHLSGGKQEFAGIEAQVSLDLLVPYAC